MRGYHVEWNDQEKSAEAVVNFLVCIEMLLFAWWHRYAYSHKEVWDLKPEDCTVKRLADEKHYTPPHLVLRFNVFKMMNDVGYLLNNRVRGQFQVVDKLQQAKRSNNLDGVKEEIKRDFHYFELDENQE